MLNFIKEQFYKLLLCFIYTLITTLIYGIWSYKLWSLWYVTLIIVLVVISVGVVISYFWIKSEIKAKQQENTIENNNQ